MQEQTKQRGQSILYLQPADAPALGPYSRYEKSARECKQPNHVESLMVTASLLRPYESPKPGSPENEDA